MKIFFITVLLLFLGLGLIFLLDIISIFSLQESYRNITASFRVMSPSERLIFNFLIVGTITYLIWPVIQRWLPQQPPSSQGQPSEHVGRNQTK
ncbi:hypothetical protein M2444_001109 [Paenibacillus sp. PastF-3]|jgi:hypothetical protein|uniref:hypothetical protein n=1 Tax=Paenibacillus sp. PastF-3 TaxID=2940626 RepID=UPI002476AA3D|nr:hypothetical protein [Paenibacillus sp. PastF-3]MDH6369331.1 hypothetical protein [Paenibacillus sp. PastF-3]